MQICVAVQSSLENKNKPLELERRQILKRVSGTGAKNNGGLENQKNMFKRGELEIFSLNKNSSKPVNDLRHIFEKCNMKVDGEKESKTSPEEEVGKGDLLDPVFGFGLTKAERDTREKELTVEKRKRRIREFVENREGTLNESSGDAREPLAKRPRTVYNTLIAHCMSDDSESPQSKKRRVVSPAESYQIILQWLNKRIHNYSAYVSTLNDLSTPTFHDGLVLCAVAHSYAPFSFAFFNILAKTRDARLTLAWETFKSLTGEEPVYSLGDALRLPKLDRKCLLTMLIRLREQLEYSVR